MVVRTHEPVRQRLEKLMRSLPYGSKANFARMCGFATRRRLWAVARFNAWLTPELAGRLTAIMDEVARGDIFPVDTGKKAASGTLIAWHKRR